MYNDIERERERERERGKEGERNRDEERGPKNVERGKEKGMNEKK